MASTTAARKRKRSKFMGDQRVKRLLKQSLEVMEMTSKQIDEMNTSFIPSVGTWTNDGKGSSHQFLDVDAMLLIDRTTSLLDKSFSDGGFNKHNQWILKTTGGHSNTDHEVKQTGNTERDIIAELTRAYDRRHNGIGRSLSLPNKGEGNTNNGDSGPRYCYTHPTDSLILESRQGFVTSDTDAMVGLKWDKPKLRGERRRKLKPDPNAPLEPPLTGWIVFVAQRTYQFRRKNRSQSDCHQTQLTPRFAKEWRELLTQQDRQYFSNFVRECREEYRHFLLEYRATGAKAPTAPGADPLVAFKRTSFRRLMAGQGPWIRTNPALQRPLEKELLELEAEHFRELEQSNPQSNSNSINPSERGMTKAFAGITILEDKYEMPEGESEEVEEATQSTVDDILQNAGKAVVECDAVSCLTTDDSEDKGNREGVGQVAAI